MLSRGGLRALWTNRDDAEAEAARLRRSGPLSPLFALRQRTYLVRRSEFCGHVRSDATAPVDNETPNILLRDRTPKAHSWRQFPHTETKCLSRNTAISRRFDRDPIPYALETDCPLGAAGFEPLHSRMRVRQDSPLGRENSNMRISIEGCRAAPQTRSQAMTRSRGSDSKCRGSNPAAPTRPNRPVRL